MQSVEYKAFNRISGRGRGWAFTITDFVAEFGESNIHTALSSLARKGKIRRVCHGVYDYPRQSELLGKVLSPDIDQVAQALARKFNWRIQPTGDTALNLLGLSTQVPARWAYLSDGPRRQYEVGNQTLAFIKSGLKERRFKYRESALVVQAIKALGKERVDQMIIEKIQQQLDPETHKRILKDTRAVTGWIYRIIKQVCSECD
jgi:hypothetical protein